LEAGKIFKNVLTKNLGTQPDCRNAAVRSRRKGPIILMIMQPKF